MSGDLSDFFKLLAEEKKAKKAEFDSVLGDLNLGDIFAEVTNFKKIEKKKKLEEQKKLEEKKKKEEEEIKGLVGEITLDTLFEEVKTIKKVSKEKEKKKKQKEKKAILAFENFLYNDKVTETKEVQEAVEDWIQEVVKEENTQGFIQEIAVEPKSNEEIAERSLGLLSEPSEVKQQDDPLTPLDKNFATLDDLNNHYKLFLTRIQQQLSTIGGGGETRLEFLDDIDRDTAKVNGRYLKYDGTSGKWIGATAGGSGSQTLDDTLQLGNTSTLGMSVGVVTATSFSGNATSATYATTAGVSTTSGYSGIAGISTYSTTAGIATYATTAGVSTSVSGGTASVTQLNVSGVSTFQNNVKIATAGALYLGDNNDFQIYYSGSNNVLRDTGVGDLYLASTPAVRITNTNFNKTAAIFTDGGSVELYFNNTKEFETTGYGATVYGTLQSQGLNVSGVTTSTSGFVGDLTGNASSATYATTAGVSTYATTAGIATYTTSSGIATYASTAGVSTTSGYSTTAGIATYATTAGVSTYATNAGIATYSTTAGVSTSVIGGISSVTQIQVTGVSTFTNGPVLVGSGTSTGTASQRLQVTGGGYVSGKFGVGTTLPTSNVSIAGSFAAGIYADTFAVSNDGDGIVRAGSNIINGSVGTSRVNIQDRAGSLLSFYYSTGLIGRINVVNTTDLSVEVGGSERVRIHNSTGNVGVGTNNATEALTVYPKIQILNNSNADGRLIFRAKPGNAYRWNIDNDGDTNNLRFFKEDDANAANGAAPFQITPTGNATLSGNLNAAGNYYVKLARTSNQTINNGSDTLIGFSAISDGNSWFNSGNNRITPTVAGNYCINAMVKWEAGAATNTVQSNIQIRKNGNTVALSVFGVQTHTYTMNINAIVTMNGSSDYIEFTVYTGNPTSQVVGGDAGGTLTKLEMFKLN